LTSAREERDERGGYREHRNDAGELAQLLDGDEQRLRDEVALDGPVLEIDHLPGAFAVSGKQPPTMGPIAHRALLCSLVPG
jgi:hypothetical protein